MQPHEVDLDSFSYGAEHELGDWDNRVQLPAGYARSPDYTIVNTNGVAAQPNPRDYRYGGEFNTPPTYTMEEQADCIEVIKSRYPNCTVNHRSNLHIHIRIPGLNNDLELLKGLQSYIHGELPKVINLLEPIPKGVSPAEKKRERRRKVSHHTFLSQTRLGKQLEAKSVKEFFELECPKTKAGKVMWHAQPRLAVGLRQLLQTNTIEFRHFPGTLDREELLTCIRWCDAFIRSAIDNNYVEDVWKQFSGAKFPTFPVFDEEREIGYQATAAHSGLTKQEIKNNIQLILEGKFHGSSAWETARKLAQGT